MLDCDGEGCCMNVFIEVFVWFFLLDCWVGFYVLFVLFG